MTLWLITPSARYGDSRWLDHPIWLEVIVRAPSAARARLLAAKMEAGQIADATPVGNETHTFHSAFQDEKLYQVRQLNPGDAQGHDPEGEERVLSATLGAVPHDT
ncbi:hypothetical protein [Pelagibius marinus]|uniref:hypothetical protein n=1 Tax=Pelagibius marinus TaxID=2762760 RepID=UPI0018732317|nr:hypothetical protein [Pelagibius marinus]